MNKTIINLVKVSGMCAILYGVLWVASMVVAAAGTPFGDPDDMGQYLLEVNAAQTAYLVSNWLAVISHIVGLPVALGFYHVLRWWGALLWVGVLAFIMGGVFFIAANILFRAFTYELGSRYVLASEATRPALEVVASTLYQTRVIVDLIAHELFFSIGIGLFSLAILGTSVAPKWVGWFGLFGAIVAGVFSLLTLPVLVGWFATLELVSVAAGVIMGIGMLAAYGWTVVMGVVLLRLREPVPPATET